MGYHHASKGSVGVSSAFSSSSVVHYIYIKANDQ